MHTKSNFASGDAFRCCICFHVRTGAIILGIWHLVLHILALILLFSVLVHPEARNHFTAWAATPAEYYSSQLPDITPGSATNWQAAFGKEKHQLKEVHVTLAVTICTGVLTSFFVYGAVRGKPNYLMPFFSLQVFDFIISALTAVGYFSSVPDVRRNVVEAAAGLSIQKDLFHLNPEWLCAILMIAVVICMMMKAYFMGMVWSCYKYLKLLQVAQIVGTYIESDNEALLPPDYDTATKAPPHVAMFAPPPPPYAADFHGV